MGARGRVGRLDSYLVERGLGAILRFQGRASEPRELFLVRGHPIIVAYAFCSENSGESILRSVFEGCEVEGEER